MKNKHSIKKTLLTGMIVLAAAITVLCGLTNAILLYDSSVNHINSRLNDNVTAYNYSVQNAITVYKTKIEAIAEDPTITDPKKTATERGDRLNALAQKYGFDSVVLADTNGKTTNGAQVANRDYFKQAMAGKTNFSSTLVGSVTHKTLLIVAAREDTNHFNGVVYGMLSSDIFSKMVRDVSVGKSGYGFIVDKTGKIIAHKDQKVVTAFTNYIEKAKKDSSYAGTASIIQNMISGKSGVETAKFNGKDQTVSYAKIPDTDGWSIGVTANMSEMMGKFYQSIGFTVALAVVFILLAIFIAFRIAKPIADPITALAARIEKLSKGDIHSAVPQINSSNEIGTLSKSFTKTVNTLQDYVGEISDVLSALQKGDCTVETKQDYQGDFVTIKVSLQGIIDNLNNMFSKARTSAEQVSGGAEQVSNAAQSLSQGATEQASSVEELSASITEINTKIGTNADNSTNANTLSTKTWGLMDQGRKQMQQMISAMKNISDSSAKIQKIIKTIQDIAFQTNILSLNAAVEAARAGEAGKGFAVVADEVRNLAGKSASAAKDTSELIENSLVAVKNGNTIAQETEKSFQGILEASEKIEKLIGDISSDSNKQAATVSQITQGVEQISEVVQTNSATSEECAAASEELSSQARLLKETLAFLKLK